MVISSSYVKLPEGIPSKNGDVRNKNSNHQEDFYQELEIAPTIIRDMT